MDTQHNEDKLFTLKEMESAVKNTFDAVHYHHQHPDTFPAVSEFDCYEKFIPIPATPPTPVSRTAEEIEEMGRIYAVKLWEGQSPMTTYIEESKMNFIEGFNVAMELLRTQPEEILMGNYLINNFQNIFYA